MASGIGLAIARGLAARGVRIVLADIEQSALDVSVRALRSFGDSVKGFRMDVADFAQVEQLAAFCTATFGPTHLLFNNAGVSITGPTWELSLDDWRWVWGVNVAGVVHGIKAFVPRMLQHGEESYVVNVGSLASFSGIGDHAPYCATKAAVLSITQSLYGEMRALMTNIGVSIVCPGMVDTRIHESWRNRPPGDSPWSHREVEDEERIAISRSVQARGESADSVAEKVFEGMLADRFYIYTASKSETFVRASLVVPSRRKILS